MGAEVVVVDLVLMTDVAQGAVVASDEIQGDQEGVASEGAEIVMADQGVASVGDLAAGSDQVAVTVTRDHLRRAHQEVMSAARTLVDPAEVVAEDRDTAQGQAEVMTVQEALKAADSKLKYVIFLSSLAR